MYNFILFLLLWSSFFLGCIKEQNGKELVILSPHSPEITREFTVGFQEWYAERTGKKIELKWLNVGGTGDAIEYVKSRNAPEKPVGGVDIFFGGGDVPYLILEKLKLLAPCTVPDSILQRVPSEISGVRIYSRDWLWFGAALSSFGILLNKSVAADNQLPLPERWGDLARPQYFGWVSMGDPRFGGTLHIMVEIILQSYGWEKGWEILLRMGGNARAFEKSAGIVAKDVALGQSAFGLAIDFYAFAEIDRYGPQRLAFVIPDSESIINPDGIALIKNAKEPQAAALFVEYVLSAGQKLWFFKKDVPGGPRFQSLCRMPVDSVLYSESLPESRSVSVSPFALKPLAYNSALSSKRWSLINDLVASMVIAPHADLRAAWNLQIKSGGRATRLYAGPSEADVAEFSISWNLPENGLERIRMMNQWTKRAKKRYSDLERGEE